jgi:hypothetical protein
MCKISFNRHTVPVSQYFQVYSIFKFNFSVANVQFCINLHTISVFRNLQFAYLFAVPQALMGDFFDFFLFMYIILIQQFFICRPSDSTVSEDAGIEPRTVATLALTARRSNHPSFAYQCRVSFVLHVFALHPQFAYSIRVSVSSFLHTYFRFTV